MNTDELFTIKRSKKYPSLSVVKYKKKVFYENLWNKDKRLLECRGRVIDDCGKTVINPFTKIFNYLENGTSIDDEERCLCVDKINGFLACVTYNDEFKDVIVSTTGSLDSDYVEIAKETIPDCFINYVLDKKQRNTYMFEIVSDKDILKHPIREECGAYLIGMRSVDDEMPYFSTQDYENFLDELAGKINCQFVLPKDKSIKRPEWRICDFSNIKEISRSSRKEGYVVYGQTSKKVLKIKTPFYLTKKALMRKKDILTLDKSKVDEEFYGLIDYCKNIYDFKNMSEHDREAIIERYFSGMNYE